MLKEAARTSSDNNELKCIPSFVCMMMALQSWSEPSPSAVTCSMIALEVEEITTIVSIMRR